MTRHHTRKSNGSFRHVGFATAALAAVLTVATSGAAFAQDVVPFLPPGAEDPSGSPAAGEPTTDLLAAGPRATSPFSNGEEFAPQPAFGSIAGAPVTFGSPTASEMRRRIESATSIPRAEANPFAGQFGGQGRMIEQDQRHRLIDELSVIARDRLMMAGRDAAGPRPEHAGSADVP